MFENTRYYLLWCERTQIKQSTLVGYKQRIEVFSQFLQEQGVDFESFDIDRFFVDDYGRYYPMDSHFIEQYVEFLGKKYLPNKPSMPGTCFTALRNFFSTLKSNGLIQKDPTVDATGPEFYYSQRTVALTKEELQALLDVAYRKDPFTLKFVAIILVLGLGGLRNQELRFLTNDRIDTKHGFIIVDQGQKTAPGGIQMAPLLKEALNRYLNHPYWKGLSKEFGNERVFMDNSGKQMTARQLIYLVSKMAEKAGIEKRVTPYVLRHTVATLMRKAGIHPALIRRHLRHKNENTTNRYIHTTSDEDRRVLENWSGTKMLMNLLDHYQIL